MRMRICPRFWLIIIALMLIVFGASFAAAQNSLREDRHKLDAAYSEYREMQQTVEGLREELEFVQTDEYIIRVARAELSMIMPGEIRYVNGQ